MRTRGPRCALVYAKKTRGRPYKVPRFLDTLDPVDPTLCTSSFSWRHVGILARPAVHTDDALAAASRTYETCMVRKQAAVNTLKRAIRDFKKGPEERPTKRRRYVCD